MSFSSEAMALGYAWARPPVHSRVLELVWGRRAPFCHALDVGCGSGVSTAALAGFAGLRTGVEPVEAMCLQAPGVAPAANFCIGRAEVLPFADGSFDCITAAGSLNYCDIDQFFPEAARVLQCHGTLLVYDFSPGRSFDSGPDDLDEWFRQFVVRYPYPSNASLHLDAAILTERSAPRFRPALSLDFAIPVEMTRASYLEYVMTETNVAGADEARAWCTATLEPVWAGRGAAAVLFRGYAICFTGAR